MIACPVCKADMQIFLYEGVELNRCPECGGHWLDQGELREMIRSRERVFTSEDAKAVQDSMPAPALEDAPSRRLDCPRCQRPMLRFNYQYSSGIFLDRCEEHGLWLDPGELDKIQIFAEDLERSQKGEHTLLGRYGALRGKKTGVDLLKESGKKKPEDPYTERERRRGPLMIFSFRL